MCSTATRMNRKELPQITEVTVKSSSAFRPNSLPPARPGRVAVTPVQASHSGPRSGLRLAESQDGREGFVDAPLLPGGDSAD